MATELSLTTSPHYGDFVVDPRDFTVLNGLSGNVMNFLKYALRRKHSRIADLTKAVESVQYERKHKKDCVYYTFNMSVDAFIILNDLDDTDSTIVRLFFNAEYDACVAALQDLLLETAGATPPQPEVDFEHLEMNHYMSNDVRVGDEEQFYADQK